MVVESYIIIGRIVEVNCEHMMDFGSKIRKNEDIVGYSRWDFIRSFEGYRYIIRKHNILILVPELVG